MGLLLSILYGLEATLALSLIEQLWPARPQPVRAMLANLGYLVPFMVVGNGAFRLASLATLPLVGALGGGLLLIPSSGLWFWVGTVGYIFVMDCAEWGFHVGQHKIPVLWSMHSLHHSDEQLGASTTNRHFWADHAIKALTVYVPVALIVRAPAATLAIYTWLQLYHYFPHANLRVGFGRLSWLLNSPQYHRIHHSCLSSDRDLNFAALFPIFDVLIGAYRRPVTGEFSATGLDEGRTTSNPLVMFVWPLARARR